MAKKFTGIAADFIKGIRTQFIGKGADPNDIFVQDLYDYQSPTTKSSALTRLNGSKNNILNLDNEDRKALEGLYSVFNEHITTKRDLLAQSRILYENSDIIRTLIDVMLDDGFNNFYNEKEEFKIEYHLDEEDKKLLGEDFQDNIQNIIDEFVSKFNLKQKVADIVPEIIRDGEYAFGVLFDEENRKGIKEIIDDIDVADLLPFYEGDKISVIMKQEAVPVNQGANRAKRNYGNQTPKFYNPENFVFFRLKGINKKKLNLSLFYDNDFRKEFYEKHRIRLPKYVRIPTPMYDSAIRYLNRLRVMENVSTVLDLADVLRPEIVSVTVPSQTNEVEAKQIIRDYERHLNDTGDLCDADSLDVSTLANSANRRKVLPQWMDSKGTLNSTSVGSGDSNKTEAAWNSIGRIRNLIAITIGVPPYYFNISETPADKAQTIKLYSRYTNKLTSLQKTLSDGVKDFIMLHLQKMGVNISRDNLSVTFKTLTNGDNLDDLDLMVGTIEGVNNFYKGVSEIVSDESNNFEIDSIQFKKFFDKVTSRYLNTSDIIKLKEEVIESESGPGFEAGPTDDFEYEDEFEVTGEGPSKEPDFSSVGISGSDKPFAGGEESAYDNFARQDDGINLEAPQEIITEV